MAKGYTIEHNAGERYGSWTVIGPGSNSRRIMVRCVCGKELERDAYSIRKGESRSCGCIARMLDREAFRERSTGHYREQEELDAREGKKTCAHCKERKDLSDFNKRWNGTNGRHYLCRDCDQIEQEAWKRKQGIPDKKPRIDHTGQKHNRFLILGDAPDRLYGEKRPGRDFTRMVVARCECGSEKEYMLNQILRGHSTQCKSCGMKQAWEKRRQA